jgi:hypothetical protein
MTRYTILILSLFLAESSFAAEAVTPLLGKVADAYGGRTRLEALVAFRETGHVEAATQIGRSGPLSRVFARPLRLRAEIGDEAKGKEIRLLDGAAGWRDGKPATGPALQAMTLQAVRLDLPWQLVTHQDKVTEKPAVERQGKQLRVLELALDDKLSVSAGIDPDTGRILFSIGTIAGGSMGPMTFETAYDDFRSVEGLLFAFKETNLASGTKTADTVISKVELLKAAPAGEFKP